MNRYDLMTERVEIVRGGPAPIYASSAAAIANNITVSGGPVARGKAQLTLGDTGLYRLDAMQSGPISDDTYFAIGGFLRQHDGYRYGGFPSDKGGQIRANLKHDLSNGFVKVSAEYVNDHNVFYLPIPIADPRNPSVSLNPYIDYFTGTLNSPSLRNVNIKYRDGADALQSMNRDLSNGRHMRFFNAAVDYEADFDGWKVSAKLGGTKGKSSFDAFYSTTNPVDANNFASSYLTAARNAFGQCRAARLCVRGHERPRSMIPPPRRGSSCRASIARRSRTSTRCRATSASPASSRPDWASMTCASACTAPSTATPCFRPIRTC